MHSTASFSQAGRKGVNQDATLVEISNDAAVMAIADGMGGRDSGEIASELAIKTIKSEFLKNNRFIDYPKVFEKIQKYLVEYANSNNIGKMGTTLTSCLIDKNTVKLAHVGDTRLYHLRNKGIVTKTKDQTELQELLDQKILSPRRALDYHRKNVLLSALSNYSNYELVSLEFEIIAGDRLILISDGAYSLLKKAKIIELSLHSDNVDMLSEKILDFIKKQPIQDDYSMIVYEKVKQ